MGERLLIYGACGYTGSIVARAALSAGLAPVLCGRRPEKLYELADALGTEARVASLDDRNAVDRALHDAALVLNCAGPFSRTAPPLIDGCLRAGCHYLDITGEWQSIMSAASRGAAARERGIMVMPAVGFDVVASDCLAVHVARRARRPQRMRLGLQGLALMSRGSARTIIEQLNQPVHVIRGGEPRSVSPGTLAWSFDFGAGPTPSLAVSWGDLATAPFSTAIADITTYFEATLSVRMHEAMMRTFGWAVPLTGWQGWLEQGLALLPEGPSPAERARARAAIVIEVDDEDGNVLRSRLRTPEAYTSTALFSVAVIMRVLAGDVEPGFETPGRVYGPDFVIGLPGVERDDF